jgi:hypothetical protein
VRHGLESELRVAQQALEYYAAILSEGQPEPKFGRLLGRHEESFILAFLEHTLAEQMEQTSAIPG